MSITISVQRYTLSDIQKLGPVTTKLPLPYEEALRFLFVDYTGVCGLKSAFGAQIDALATGRFREDGNVLYRDYVSEQWSLNHPEGFKKRVRALRSALMEMEEVPGSVHGTVLFYHYGLRNRLRPWAKFGDHAQYVHLTKTAVGLAVEETRKLRGSLGKEFARRMQVDAALLPSVKVEIREMVEGMRRYFSKRSCDMKAREGGERIARLERSARKVAEHGDSLWEACADDLKQWVTPQQIVNGPLKPEDVKAILRDAKGLLARANAAIMRRVP